MILVLTPLQLELEVLNEVFGQTSAGVICALGGHGKVRFALSTQKLVLEHKPHFVIGAGACGSLVPDFKGGDVVVAENTVEHDFKQMIMPGPLPRFSGDAEAIAILKTQTWIDFKVHFAAMASGDEDVVTAQRAQEVHKLTSGASAVAWEGAGLARAAKACNTPFLEIRAVTDHANENTFKDFKNNLEVGMKNVAEVIRRLSLLVPEKH